MGPAGSIWHAKRKGGGEKDQIIKDKEKARRHKPCTRKKERKDTFKKKKKERAERITVRGKPEAKFWLRANKKRRGRRSFCNTKGEKGRKP